MFAGERCVPDPHPFADEHRDAHPFAGEHRNVIRTQMSLWTLV